MAHMFVALPPLTLNQCILFAKNSHRPKAEIQEVVHYSAHDYDDNATVKCTHKSIPQIQHTYTVVLSKPSPYWGAEMGSNEHGVCIGCNPVHTKQMKEAQCQDGLTGADLVRLGLERSNSSSEAVSVMSSLLVEHGLHHESQSGPHGSGTGSYSFLLCDGQESWVLETAGTVWAAEKLEGGVRSISSHLTIETKFDKKSCNMKDVAQANAWWTPDDGDISFKGTFSADKEDACSEAAASAKELIERQSQEGGLHSKNMMQILRDPILQSDSDWLCTGSQVSALVPRDNSTPCCHWFTGTPKPAVSMFKPLFFVQGMTLGDVTVVEDSGEQEGAHASSQSSHGGHVLYNKHSNLTTLLENGDQKGAAALEQMMNLEQCCCEGMESMVSKDEKNQKKMCDIFKHMCGIEMGFY